MRDLTPDTLCTFSPDPSEQPDARWSAVGNDEDMEANVLYAVATPGILKLWPWVNQVAIAYSICQLSLTNTNQTPLTVTSKLPLEVVMQLFKRMGYVHHVYFSKVFFFSLCPHSHILFQPTCYPRGGSRQARWTHDSQGCLALRAPRATK